MFNGLLNGTRYAPRNIARSSKFFRADPKLWFFFQAAAKSWVNNHPHGRMFSCSVVDLLKFIKAKGPDREPTKLKPIFPEDAYWTKAVEEVFNCRFDESKGIGLEYRVRFKDEPEKKWVPSDEVDDDVQIRLWKKKNEDIWKPLHKRYREVKRYADKDDDAELADAEMAADKQEEDVDEDEIVVDDDEDGDHHTAGGEVRIRSAQKRILRPSTLQFKFVRGLVDCQQD